MASLDHVVDGSEQVGEMREWVGLLQVEVRSHRLRFALELGGKAEGAALAFVDPAVEHGRSGSEAVAIFDQEDGRFLVAARQIARVTLSVCRDERHGGIEQLL